MAHPTERLAELGWTLPAASTPGAACAPAVSANQFVFTSGQLPICDGELRETGKVGAAVSTHAATRAAEQCVLNALAAIQAEIGDLALIRRVVKIVVFVASEPDFTSQPQVADGASKLVLDIFGNRGVHARSAVGVAPLPRNSPVEVELIVAL